MDMLVVRLRRKIEPDPKNPSLIITVPGQGFKFAAKPGVAIPSAETSAVPASSRPPPVMRRQLTALSVELMPSDAGSPAPDPEDLSVIEAYHREATSHIARHGGTVGHCAAHEILAYFGYPSAQEDAAERAVRAGLVLLETWPATAQSSQFNLALRVGIATGLVVASGGGDGSPPRVMGEAPNLASRLRAQISPW
jgi:class 3 adenylate cyclase